jgi:hypothetical protein
MVRFQILKAKNMKMAFFWDVALCSLVEIDALFRGAYYLYRCHPDEGDSTHL